VVNNEQMSARMAPVLEASRRDAGLNERSGASEDVSFFLDHVPGPYFQSGRSAPDGWAFQF
jgi:metal-dependent amidase/aminoacylase/carboxypeptidase family protein